MKKLTLDYVKEYVEGFPEYLLISTEYVGCYQKLNILHVPCSTIYSVSWDNFKHKNCRCPVCSSKAKFTYDYVKNYINSVPEYLLISTEYMGIFEDIQIKHITCGKIYKVTLHNFKAGNRCPICNINSSCSKVSQELFNTIYKQLPNNLKVHFAELNNEYRVITKRSYRFLDFYIPSLNKCIEFDGTYWHQSEFNDRIREQEIEEVMSGIQFLRIDEQDYKNDPEKEIQKCLKYITCCINPPDSSLIDTPRNYSIPINIKIRITF